MCIFIDYIMTATECDILLHNYVNFETVAPMGTSNATNDKATRKNAMNCQEEQAKQQPHTTHSPGAFVRETEIALVVAEAHELLFCVLSV